MSNANHDAAHVDLVAFWRRLDLSDGPYVHPDDRPFFARYRPHDLSHPPLDAASYAHDTVAQDPKFTHLSLLPVPYLGNLRRADIFILMLNPGFSQIEYQVESNDDVITALRRNLAQDVEKDDYPLWYLNPQFKHHPGHRYWASHLKGVGSHRELSNRIAVVERFPYHSKEFGHTAVVRKLPSSITAKRFVREIVLPRVIRQEALLIVARGASAFGFSQHDKAPNLIVYGPGETAGAWLTDRSRGGVAIQAWIHAHPNLLGWAM